MVMKIMTSIYDKKGKVKPLKVYRDEVWAHDLTDFYLTLHLRSPTAGKEERKALIKEFHKRFPGCPLPRRMGHRR
jgi:hypothetical protein